jgi:hypothetical protein
MGEKSMRRLVLAATAGLLVLAGCSTTTSGGTSGPSSSAAASPGTVGGGAGGSTSSTVAVGSTGTTRPAAAPVDAYTSEIYKDPKHWLCKPGVTPNVCDDDMRSTSVAADGTLTPKSFTKAADPGIDCFYVYPTISADPGVNSDLEADDSSTEAGAVRNQAVRLGSVCRMYAPVYRQITLATLFGKVTGDRAEAGKIAYADVVDAWKHYLANDNKGRGVILIGHSQGSGHLTRLTKEEIDAKPEMRARIVAAYLIGGSLVVPEGADVGGDFANVPLCRANDQTGCAVAFSSFRSTAPPPANSLFGKSRSGTGVAACVNPAALKGGSAELHAEFGHTSPVLTDPAADAKITTPFVTLPGMLTGECVVENGYSYLKVTVHGDPADPRIDDIKGDLTPEWGLHLVDVNLVMDDLVAPAESQAKAYLGG